LSGELYTPDDLPLQDRLVLKSGFWNQDILKVLFSAFIITLPITNAFALAPWAPIPLIIAILIFCVLLLSGRLRIFSSDFLFVALIVSVTVPWLWSLQQSYVKSIVHFFALFMVINIYFITIRAVFILNYLNSDWFQKISFILYKATFLVSVFILCEFFFVNFLGISIDSIIPYATREAYEATIVGGIQRARGFASESGSMALFYDLALFLCLPALTTRRRKLAYLLIICGAFILLFSAGAFSVVLPCFLILAALKFRFKFLPYVKLLFVLVLFAVGLSVFFYENIENYVLISLLPKLALLSFDAGSSIGSASERLQNYQQIIELIGHYPFGVGFGITAELGERGMAYNGIPVSAGQLSFFGTFATAGGIPGLTIIFAIAINALSTAYRMRRQHPELLCGGLALTLHHVIVSDFWQPYIWFFWALTSALQNGNYVGRGKTALGTKANKSYAV